MKIAISGKGGVGKTTISALLAKIVSLKGRRVIAIDADPDANLAASLGHPAPDSIVPLSAFKDLIEERVGNEGMIRLNPKVDDLVDKMGTDIGGIKLLMLGTIPRGGGGCFCSPSALLKAFLIHVLTQPDEWVLIDMEAGLEHLGRGTSGNVDALLIVVEPAPRSLETAARIRRLAKDLGIKKVWGVANKTESAEDIQKIKEVLGEIPLLGALPYSPGLAGFSARIDLQSADPRILTSMEAIYQGIISA
jgi:CO dehydrogenase maturation factor